MKLKSPRITILIDGDGATIEIKDSKSSITFVKAILTPHQLAQALGRLSQAECECEVKGLDVVGMQQENIQHEFELPINYKGEDLQSICEKTIPAGWVSDNYYGSQGSFFSKDGKNYARVTIRRWLQDINP